MKIESKISGWSISDFPSIKRIPTVTTQIVSLKNLDSLTNKAAVQWVLDKYNMVSLNPDYADGCHYGAIMHCDDIIKVSILENHPDLANELAERFGEKWMDYYLRFGH